MGYLFFARCKMKINSNTKISLIIKENEQAIEAIASINKHFLKLKNPILRKILAGRVSVADAAKVGGVDINVIFQKLMMIGFEIETTPKEMLLEKQLINFQNPIINQDMNNIVELDVREIISSGNDPFNIIMNSIKGLPKNKILKIINSFAPIPLINILEKKGYASYTIKESPDVFNTYFKNIRDKSEIITIEQSPSTTENFEKILELFSNNIDSIDVRALEMPAPMIAILKKLEELNENTALLVHHKKIPQFLFPELQQQGFSWELKEIDENNIKLLIYK